MTKLTLLSDYSLARNSQSNATQNTAPKASETSSIVGLCGKTQLLDCIKASETMYLVMIIGLNVLNKEYSIGPKG